MWLTSLLLKYWRGLAIAAAVVTLLVTFTILKNRYETRIRSDERLACDAEWSAKNAQAQAEFDKKINEIKKTNKTIRSSFKPVSQRELISILQKGKF